jgi:hypothetical protein
VSSPADERRQYSKSVRLAGAALHAAMGDQWEKVGRCLQRISDECGGEGLGIALRGWIDTYADHATDGHADSMVPGNIKTIRTDTGQMHNPRTAADLPPQVVWASALIEARCRLDQDQYNTVLAALPDDGHQRGAYIGQVLQSVALTLNGLPRGFAWMGGHIDPDQLRGDDGPPVAAGPEPDKEEETA